MKAYYNEFDPKAAAWLRQLIKNGNITQGEVDERSITEVTPNDLRGFGRVHFFSGIGTWDYCLNRAGWGDRPIWTASLPCQPFSTAGKGLGKSDERHLLPHFLELVRQCKPNAIFGEQVEGAIKHGWLDDLQTNMEAEGYAVGHCVLGAHSIGAAHIRQRLYWVANSIGDGDKRAIRRINGEAHGGEISDRPNISQSGKFSGTSSDVRGMVYANEPRSQQGIEAAETARYRSPVISAGCVSGMADSNVTGLQGRERTESADKLLVGQNGMVDWIYCRDNKYRPIESGIKPLVDGIARGMVYSSDTSEPINANATQEARVMRLKGYGNAIQAQTAMAFISAYLGAERDRDDFSGLIGD